MRRVSLSFLLTLVVALLLRLGYAWNYRATHSEQALRAIPFLYEPGNIAASLADGKGFSSPLRVDSGPTAWTTPVYPLLLSALFHLFGTYSYPAWQAAVAANIVFGVLTCVPVFLIGRRVGGAVAGALGAGLWAVFPNALIIPVESMWDASLAALLGACLVLQTLRVCQFRGWWHWAGYGALWGVALMTNPTLGLALPFLLVWMAWQSRRWAGPALASAVIAICCAPWTVRNLAVMHAWIPLRSVGGVSLWMGTIDPDRGHWPGFYHPLANAQERAQFMELGEIAYMERKQKESVALILTHPGTEARLCGERFAALWAGGALHPWTAFLQNGSAWFRFVLLSDLTLAGAGLAGIVLLLKSRNREGIAVAVIPVVVPLAFYLTLASARYRLLVDPEVIVLGAVAASKTMRAVLL